MKIPPLVFRVPTRSPNLSPTVAPSRGGTAGRSLAERDKGRGVTPSPAGSGTAGSNPSHLDRPARAAAEKAKKRPPAFN
jgi:hypothetical protein